MGARARDRKWVAFLSAAGTLAAATALAAPPFEPRPTFPQPPMPGVNGEAAAPYSEDYLQKIYRACSARQQLDGYAMDHASSEKTVSLAREEKALMGRVMEDLIRLQESRDGQRSRFQEAGAVDDFGLEQLSRREGKEVDRQFLLGLIQDSSPLEFSLAVQTRRLSTSADFAWRTWLAGDMKALRKLRDEAGPILTNLEPGVVVWNGGLLRR